MEEQNSKFLNSIFTQVFQGQNSILNDVEIHCEDGIYRVPSVFLAAISPLFKATAPFADFVEMPSLILPDFAKKDVEEFFESACKFHQNPAEDKMDIFEAILNLLCQNFQDEIDSLFPILDQDWQELDKENSKPKKKAGRKPGQKLNVKTEPYIKTEVMDSHRVSERYGLRTTVKRKRFTDEISEPSDLDEEDDEQEAFADLDSEDEYNPEEVAKNLSEEESDEESDEFEEDELESPNEDELLDSDEEIIDFSDETKKVESSLRGLETFTVKLGPEGELVAISSLENPEKSTKGRPRKSQKTGDLVAIGRVISVMEDEDLDQLAFKGKKIYSDVKNDPRSILKTDKSSGQIPLILFCSVCEASFHSQSELKIHAAQNHKGSKFFKFPKDNPHSNCVKCTTLLESYEDFCAQNPEEDPKNICFPCPHCRRRYLGHLGGLATHLMTDHRSHVCENLTKNPEYYHVIPRNDEKVCICDFCGKKMPHTTALNKHLIACPQNDSGCSAGLFCHICGKMFAQQKYLKDHLTRHGKEAQNRSRNFFCPQCPVTCVSEANLQKHLEREHSNKDPDEGFVLHENCLRCSKMFDSYIENKSSQKINFRDMVFKCPHCCMVLYANHKHAPRYLYNHVNKFHMDPEINDFTLGPDPNEFRLRSKSENNVLTCEFCGFASKSRASHNVHLSTCKQSTVPCRPGYMCDTCGFIAGTAVHLRNHLETHNDPRTFECDQCSYTGRSKRYLLLHIKNHHTEEGIRKRFEAPQVPCPRCGKLKKDGAVMKAHMKKCGVGAPRVNCPHCNLEFKRAEDMKAHFLIHKGVITCPVHNILFQDESEVYQHVNKAEPDDKFPKLECCICSKSFKHMCLFMKHLRKELRILPYRCNLCGKHVNTYASLQLHMKRLHSSEKLPPKEKNFKCDQCGKLFYSRGHLNEHINGVHNRSSSVQCPECGKSFHTAKRMKKHLFNAHKESAEQFRSWSGGKNEPFATIAIKFN